MESRPASVGQPDHTCLVMFQEPALFPWLDVMGNVMFGLKLKPGLTHAQRRETAEHYLRLVGLEKFQHAYVPLCCMGRGSGRTGPYPVRGSGNADGLRASQVQHAVE